MGVRKTARWVALAASLAGGVWAPGALAQPSTQNTNRDLALAVGEQRVIPADGIRSFSVGTEGIVEVRVSGDQTRLILVGQRPGTTSLVLIRSNGSQETYQVSVFAQNPARIQTELEGLLEAYQGVQVRRVGARLYIEGGVPSEVQQRRIQQIAANYAGQVESLVTIDGTIVERRINVRLDLYFVDFSAERGHQFGISYPASIGGNPPNTQFQSTINLVAPMGMGGSAGIAQAQALITNQALPRLDIASNGGYARILRQATIITANGTEATYRNGGEFNFRLVGSNGSASLARIEFGTTLTVTPRFDPQSSRIDIRVDTDISDPVFSGQELPGRDISHLTTLVNLQLGQSIVMSGFRSRSQTTGSSGLPGLRQIPILGYLFGTEQGRSQEREGMIFIVPTVVEGLGRSQTDRVAEALRQYEQFSGDIDEVRLYDPTGAQYR
ncbi:MAG: pilus assembly protein N-terminal domain-containing protein [Deltaproteobacteria bacterium]|nr:pilus assembly protein N-terminal domain-containing protein [Deltaproteobacteria bacterium]